MFCILQVLWQTLRSVLFCALCSALIFFISRPLSQMLLVFWCPPSALSVYFSAPHNTTLHIGIFIILLFSSLFNPLLISFPLSMNACLPTCHYSLFFSVWLLTSQVTAFPRYLNSMTRSSTAPIHHDLHPLNLSHCVMSYILFSWCLFPCQIHPKFHQSAWFIVVRPLLHLSLLDHQQNVYYFIRFPLILTPSFILILFCPLYLVCRR